MQNGVSLASSFFGTFLTLFRQADCVLRVHCAISADLGHHIYPLYALISSTFSCYCCEVGLYLHLVPTVPHFPRLSQGVPPIAHTRGCATLVHRNCMTVFVSSLSDVWCCRLLPRASRVLFERVGTLSAAALSTLALQAKRAAYTTDIY